MGSIWFTASLRRIHEPAVAPPAPAPPPAPAVPAGRMQEPPPITATRLLPFDLLLMMGTHALTLFPRGPFDELTFFQREVKGQHDLEYVTRLDEAFGETQRGYGMFRLDGESEPLIDLTHQADLWQRLHDQYGLRQLPDARLLITEEPLSYDPRRGTGRNRLSVPRERFYRAHGQRDLDWDRALRVLRQVCRPRQLIAWIESGIPETRPGKVLHRYYIDARHNTYLVRHEYRSRRLFVPRRCAPSEVQEARNALRVPQWPPARDAA